jgi:hypothetical protein
MAPASDTLEVPSAVPAESPQEPQAHTLSPAFVLRVLPLEDSTQDEASRASVAAFHAGVMEHLRRINGIRLVTPGSEGVQEPADFQLAIKAVGSARDNKWSATMILKSGFDAKGAPRTNLMSVQNSVLTPVCSGLAAEVPDVTCSDPQDAALRTTELLRQSAFPVDPVWRRELSARLRDRSQNDNVRLRSLLGLRNERMNVRTDDTKDRIHVTMERPELDQDAVRGAIDLAATAGSPTVKANVWRLMRGVREPALIPPLVESLRVDIDESVRTEAVTVLAGLADHPRARAALQSTARDDARPLMRMIAQQGLGGGTSWNEYATTMLRDSAASDAQRVEALVYLASQGRAAEVKQVTDAESVAALAEILPRMLTVNLNQAVANWPGTAALASLVSSLPDAKQAGFADVYIALLASSKDPLIRVVAVNRLREARDDPKVLQVLNDIAAGDPDTRLREAAAIVPPRVVIRQDGSVDHGPGRDKDGFPTEPR